MQNIVRCLCFSFLAGCVYFLPPVHAGGDDDFQFASAFMRTISPVPDWAAASRVDRQPARHNQTETLGLQQPTWQDPFAHAEAALHRLEGAVVPDEVSGGWRVIWNRPDLAGYIAGRAPFFLPPEAFPLLHLRNQVVLPDNASVDHPRPFMRWQGSDAASLTAFHAIFENFAADDLADLMSLPDARGLRFPYLISAEFRALRWQAENLPIEDFLRALGAVPAVRIIVADGPTGTPEANMLNDLIESLLIAVDRMRESAVPPLNLQTLELVSHHLGVLRPDFMERLCRMLGSRILPNLDAIRVRLSSFDGGFLLLRMPRDDASPRETDTRER